MSQKWCAHRNEQCESGECGRMLCMRIHLFGKFPIHSTLKWAKLFDNAEVIVLLYYGHKTEWKLFPYHLPCQVSAHILRLRITNAIFGNFNICQFTKRPKLMWQLKISVFVVDNLYIPSCVCVVQLISDRIWWEHKVRQ